MSLVVYNTLSREKEPFEPIDPSHVRLYVCGPTVYDYVHIGNARPVVAFDTLYRLLKRHYPRVTYVRNITDIDDKIMTRALESGVSIDALTDAHGGGLSNRHAPPGRARPRCRAARHPVHRRDGGHDRPPDRERPRLSPPKVMCCSACRAWTTMAACRGARATS